MHILFNYVFDYLVFLKCGQCFPEIECIYMHEYILKKTFNFPQDGPRIFKDFVYNSGLILSMWKKP